MLEAYTTFVALELAAMLFFVGGAMLVETIIDIVETKTGKTLESILEIEEEGLY